MPNSLRWTPEQLDDWQRRQRRTHPSTPPAPSPVVRAKTVRLSSERADAIATYLQQLQLAGIEAPATEFRFHATRQWRADFAWIDHKVLAEYEGGIYNGGAHTRGKHYESDCEKYNEVALAGFVLLRFTVNMVKSGLALQQTERALTNTPRRRSKPDDIGAGNER